MGWMQSTPSQCSRVKRTTKWLGGVVTLTTDSAPVSNVEQRLACLGSVAVARSCGPGKDPAAARGRDVASRSREAPRSRREARRFPNKLNADTQGDRACDDVPAPEPDGRDPDAPGMRGCSSYRLLEGGGIVSHAIANRSVISHVEAAIVVRIGGCGGGSGGRSWGKVVCWWMWLRHCGVDRQLRRDNQRCQQRRTHSSLDECEVSNE